MSLPLLLTRNPELLCHGLSNGGSRLNDGDEGSRPQPDGDGGGSFSLLSPVGRELLSQKTSGGFRSPLRGGHDLHEPGLFGVVGPQLLPRGSARERLGALLVPLHRPDPEMGVPCRPHLPSLGIPDSHRPARVPRLPLDRAGSLDPAGAWRGSLSGADL